MAVWRAGRALAVLLVAAAGATAQDDAAFVAAYERFTAASGDERTAAARAASDRFLALAAAAPRARHLAAAVHATAVAGRTELALDLAREARAAGATGGPLVEGELTALVQSGRFDAFVDRARADLAVERGAVERMLAAHEAQLLPRAEQALRHGDTARGRFVFAALAAIAPPQSYRLGNLALCLRQLGDLAAAARAYEAARAAAPDDLELENDHGLFLRATGDLDGAVRAFRRAWALDLARPDALRAQGPAITNLMHLEATRPGRAGADPAPDADLALARRQEAVMLKRLVLDVALDRLAARAR